MAADKTAQESQLDRIEAKLDELAAWLADEGVPSQTPTGGLVDAAALGRVLGLSAATVRAKARTGVIPVRRVGNGPRARLRFDVDAARAALEAAERPVDSTVTPRKRRSRPGGRPEGGWRVGAPGAAGANAREVRR